MVVAVLAAVLAGRAGHRVATTAPSGGSLSRGASVPFGAVADWKFTNTQDGYGLVFGSGGTYLAGSVDGGRTWRVSSGDVLSGAQISNPSSSIEPRSTALSGCPTRTDCAGLLVVSGGRVFVYSTGASPSVVAVGSDGGRHWSASTLPGVVQQLSAAGGTVWALIDRRPGVSQGLFALPPVGQIWVNAANGWQLRSTLPVTRGGGSLVGGYRLLLRTTPSTAYVLAPGEQDPMAGYYGGLVSTSDGGSTWRVLDSPCAFNEGPRFSQRAELGSASPLQLWMVCGQRPGNLSAAEVARSVNGGRSWTVVAGTPDTNVWPHTFPTTGSVPFAGHNNTAVFGRHTQWVLLSGPGQVIESTDGGRHWATALPPAARDQQPYQILDAGGRIKLVTSGGVWDRTSSGWTLIATTASRPGRTVVESAPVASRTFSRAFVPS